jgi:hypothetical protein
VDLIKDKKAKAQRGLVKYIYIERERERETEREKERQID